MLETKNG